MSVLLLHHYKVNQPSHAGVATPSCVLLHPAVQLALPDLYPTSIWHRSLLALNGSRMVKWETKLSIQNQKDCLFEWHHRGAFRMWHSLVENNWMLWALTNGLNTACAFHFTWTKNQTGKLTFFYLKKAEIEVKNCICWVQYIRASQIFWNNVSLKDTARSREGCLS